MSRPKDHGFDDESLAKTFAEPSVDEPTEPSEPSGRASPRSVIASGVRALPLYDDDDYEHARALRSSLAEQSFLSEPPDTVALPPPIGTTSSAEPPSGPQAAAEFEDCPPTILRAPDAGRGWQLRPGEVIGGRYTIVAPLAKGGMAEVYLAEQGGAAGFVKRVVVKRILPQFAGRDLFVEHFVREANIVSSLMHPNIAQVYELGDDRGGFFIAMEHVVGISLSDLAERAWRQGRSLPIELVLMAIADAAEGLVYGWRLPSSDGKPLRLVHRDVSPDNLMITEHGITKVLDYGLSKSEESQDLTVAGELKGKLSFMPPEGMMTNRRDHRSDLYALGVTAYWLCTGQKPFDAKGAAEYIKRVLSERPPRMRSHNTHVPREVDDLVLKLLEKEPARRFDDGQALAERIHALVGAVRRADLGDFVKAVQRTTTDGGGRAGDDVPAAVVAFGRLGSGGG